MKRKEGAMLTAVEDAKPKDETTEFGGVGAQTRADLAAALSRGKTVQVLICTNPKGRRVAILKSAMGEVKDFHLWTVHEEVTEPDYNFAATSMPGDTLAGWAEKSRRDAAAKIAARRERA
jgi:hypothetical protein